MILTPSEFETQYRAGQLKIAFVGMSNIGKSYTAKRLSQSHDFDLVEIDRLIWKELEQGSMADFALWQGQPYTQGYDAREAVSIELETKAMTAAMTQVNTSQAEKSANANVILDTTGSVIYIGGNALKRLKDEYLIVHIAAAAQDLERLKRDYFALPKPLVWRGHYRPKDGLTEKESILACYPDLLQSRKQAYEGLADITLQSGFVLDPSITMDAVFQAIKREA